MGSNARRPPLAETPEESATGALGQARWTFPKGATTGNRRRPFGFLWL